MCLYKTHWFPKIALKPIKCYKVVRTPFSFEKSFYTLYTEKLYNLNEPIEHSVKSLGLFKRTLEGEVVHAYINYIEALKRKNITCQQVKIVECVIPRFTIYWSGILNEIGARRLIPLKFK